MGRFGRSIAAAIVVFLAISLAGCAPVEEETPESSKAFKHNPRAARLLDDANYFPGDFHAHSEYSHLDIASLPQKYKYRAGEFSQSDGKGTPDEYANQAFNKKGLSWLAMTEHGPQIGMRDGSFLKYDAAFGSERWETEYRKIQDMESAGKASCMMLGEEMGTLFSGHLLVYNMGRYLEDGPADRNQDGFLSVVEESRRSGNNCFSFIAHPSAESKGGWYWKNFDRDISTITNESALRGFEILSGRSNKYPSRKQKDGNPSLLETWDSHLSAGERVLVMGGSDSHTPEEVGGNERTYLYLERSGRKLGPSEQDNVLEATRTGRSIVTTGPLFTFFVLNERTGEVAGPGEEIKAMPKDRLQVVTRSSEKHPCDSVKVASSLKVEKGDGKAGQVLYVRVPADFEKDSGYIRVEGHSGDESCYANAVFVSNVNDEEQDKEALRKSVYEYLRDSGEEVTLNPAVVKVMVQEGLNYLQINSYSRDRAEIYLNNPGEGGWTAVFVKKQGAWVFEETVRGE